MSRRFDLRTIEPGERDAVLDLLAGWLNDRAFFARYFAHDPTFRDDLCFVGTDAGRIVSTLQVFRKTVRVDGAALAVGGVGNVYTDPTYRHAGVASALLERAIAVMQRHGFDASLLFASRLDFYARFGWQSHLRYLSFIEPGAPTVLASPGDPFEVARDLDAVMAMYGAHSSTITGSTLRNRAYWTGQLGYAGNPDEHFLVARRGGELVAYARRTTLYDFNAIIEHGCAPGAEAVLGDLICHLHAGAATGTLAQLVPSPELDALLRARGLVVTPVEDRSWMWRVIDAEHLAATLRVPTAAVQREGFFAELLPAERSRYWLSDRF